MKRYKLGKARRYQREHFSNSTHHKSLSNIVWKIHSPWYCQASLTQDKKMKARIAAGHRGQIWKFCYLGQNLKFFCYHRQNLKILVITGKITLALLVIYHKTTRQMKERKIIWISKFWWDALGTASIHSSTLQQLKMLTKWQFAQKLDSALFVSP